MYIKDNEYDNIRTFIFDIFIKGGHDSKDAIIIANQWLDSIYYEDDNIPRNVKAPTSISAGDLTDRLYPKLSITPEFDQMLIGLDYDQLKQIAINRGIKVYDFDTRYELLLKMSVKPDYYKGDWPPVNIYNTNRGDDEGLIYKLMKIRPILVPKPYYYYTSRSTFRSAGLYRKYDSNCRALSVFYTLTCETSRELSNLITSSHLAMLDFPKYDKSLVE